MKILLNTIVIVLLAASISCGQNRVDSKLYVFIGEKIQVEQFQPKLSENQILMDEVFKAKYRIIKNVYGGYNKDTIEFEVYDHYGFPAFAEYKHVLLYVSEYEGKLYHEKYQYSDVYQTKNGRWASRYSPVDYTHPYNENTRIKPEKIDFKEVLTFDLRKYDKEVISEWFPKPYYRIEGNKAIAVMGNYLEELFQLKKDGVLKARNFFE